MSVRNPAPFLSSLPLMILLAGCEVRDPAGTSWTTRLRVETSPETLRVADVLEHENVRLQDDSLLVFRQPLEATYANLGDSLLWDGARGARFQILDPLVLDVLPAVDAQVGFSQAWPQHAGLVGQTVRIAEGGQASLDLPLPPAAGLEWIAFRSVLLDVGLSHAWPFVLDVARLEWRSPQGTLRGSVDLAPAGGLAPGVPAAGELELQGLVTPQDHVRLVLHHLPMDQATLIADTGLDLALQPRPGVADSVRTVPQELERAWSVDLAVNPRLVVHEARTEPARLDLRVVNATALPLDLELEFPQLRAADGSPLRRSLAAGAGDEVARNWETGPLDVDAPGGMASLRLDVVARFAGGGEAVTVRGGDGLGLELDLRPVQLESFTGSFSQPVRVPIEPTETSVEDWPEELTLLSMDSLAMGLELDYRGGAPLTAELVLEALESRLGLADTTFELDVAVTPGDTLLQRQGAGRLVSHLPGRLRLSGGYRIPAHEVVQLEGGSRAGIPAVRLPARARVAELRWQSVPERHDEEVPEDVGSLRLRGHVENRLPVGGTIQGWVAATAGGPRVPLFQLDVAPAMDGSSPQPALSTFELALPDEALAVLRAGAWYLGHQFDSAPTEGVAEIHAGQWLVVHTLIEADVELDVDGGRP